MDIGSYFNYALRLWSFDEQAAQELRDKEASSVWMSLGIAMLFAVLIVIISGLTEFITLEEGILSSGAYIVFFGIGFLLGILIFAPIVFLLSMLWSQMWIKIFGGDRPFAKTVELFVIIAIPSYLITIGVSIIELIVALFAQQLLEIMFGILLGLISFAVGVYAAVVIVKTFSITHNMGVLKAFLAGFTSFAVIALVAIIFTIVFVIIFGLSMMSTMALYIKF